VRPALGAIGAGRGAGPVLLGRAGISTLLLLIVLTALWDKVAARATARVRWDADCCPGAAWALYVGVTEWITLFGGRPSHLGLGGTIFRFRRPWRAPTFCGPKPTLSQRVAENPRTAMLVRMAVDPWAAGRCLIAASPPAAPWPAPAVPGGPGGGRAAWARRSGVLLYVIRRV